jgi:alpha-glucosidase
VAEWWKTGVIYQVYPRSFMDASGDGTGDLRGITGRLDYLEWLGVDAVWLSPIYPSPMADFGYDISDHTDVDPTFGTLSDFDELLAEAHRRGMRVILDYVPNHTSDEHPWFLESRSSRENLRRDWYIWADPDPGGGPPNNWQSFFGGGSAWEWDGATEQYYLHLFDPKQPDLNWRNPEVREAMYDVLRFWFDRGVDGFRIDVLWLPIKDELFRDDPPNPQWREGDPPWKRLRRTYSGDRPEILDIVRKMRAVADSYEGDRALIGELYLPLERVIVYYGAPEFDGVHLPFNFALAELREWEPHALGKVISAYEAALPEGAWPNWVLGNHDKPRILGRVGEHRARLAQMLLLTLRGTPTCYYGDEIGMRDVEIPPDLVVDPQGKRSPGYGRDPARTPMQWDATPNAGFCPPDVEPWLPIPDDHGEVNAEAQRGDPTSMLSLFRRLVRLRREHTALTLGSYEEYETGASPVVAYLREHGGHRILVALNFGDADERVEIPAGAKLLSSTDPERGALDGSKVLELRSREGVVLAL